MATTKSTTPRKRSASRTTTPRTTSARTSSAKSDDSIVARTGRTIKERPYTSAAIATGAVTVAAVAAAAGVFLASRRDKSFKEASGEYFAGKRVALFAVPGAYTPTCSAKHLPSYVERAADLKGKGIDEIVATSVNDAFVLGAWNKEQGSEDITMLADGNGDFAKGLGLELDGSKFGMGQRSQRYSMIVHDGVVEQLNVEAPGEYQASSAETMLGQL